MKAGVINQFGGAEVIVIEDREKPVPAADEVLIKTSVAGINYADIARRRNTYLTEIKLPYVLGLEAAGVVEEVGADVEGFKPGDRVLAILGGGGYAEYAVAKAQQLFHVPDNLSFAESTALLVQGMTAVGLLDETKAGQTILVHAAAGGVGTLLVQLAKHKGLTIIGTASTSEKLEAVADLGADFAINYVDDDWAKRVLDVTGGRGVDVVIEMVGGDVVQQSLELLALNGTMIVYGSASGEDYRLRVLDLLKKNLTVRGYWLSLEPAERRAKFANELIEHISAGRLKIAVTEFPLAKAAEAHRAVESRKTTGKVVLTIDEI